MLNLLNLAISRLLKMPLEHNLFSEHQYTYHI